jgi:hypothetical protein
VGVVPHLGQYMLKESRASDDSTPFHRCSEEQQEVCVSKTILP